MAKPEKDKNAWLIQILNILGLIFLLMFVVIYRYKVNMPEPQYYNFFQQEDGKVKYQRMDPLRRPVVTRVSMLVWTTLAVTSINTYTAANVRVSLPAAVNRFFTQDSAESYIETLQNQGLFDEVEDKQIVSNAVVVGQPVILRQGTLLGVYTWKVQMPVLITSSSFGVVTTNKIMVTVLVVQIPTWQSERGIGIKQFYSASV